MGVIAKNERSSVVRFINNKRGQSDKFIAPGESKYLTDEEWSEVAIAMRGPGGLNPQGTSTITSELAPERTELDYYNAFATVQLRYLGENAQDAPLDDPTWTIKRFSHFQDPLGDVRITEILVMKDVAWTDRDTLSW